MLAHTQDPTENFLRHAAHEPCHRRKRRPHRSRIAGSTIKASVLNTMPNDCSYGPLAMTYPALRSFAPAHDSPSPTRSTSAQFVNRWCGRVPTPARKSRNRASRTRDVGTGQSRCRPRSRANRTRRCRTTFSIDSLASVPLRHTSRSRRTQLPCESSGIHAEHEILSLPGLGIPEEQRAANAPCSRVKIASEYVGVNLP